MGRESTKRDGEGADKDVTNRKIVKIDFIEYLKSMIIYIHLFHPMAKIKNEIVKIVVHHEPYAFPVHGSIVLFMILEVV
jgi:hypothetical protein